MHNGNICTQVQQETTSAKSDLQIAILGGQQVKWEQYLKQLTAEIPGKINTR